MSPERGGRRRCRRALTRVPGPAIWAPGAGLAPQLLGVVAVVRHLGRVVAAGVDEVHAGAHPEAQGGQGGWSVAMGPSHGASTGPSATVNAVIEMDNKHMWWSQSV